MKVKISMGKPFAPVVDLTNLDRSRITFIKFKDKYIELYEDEDGELQHYSWSKNPDMFPDLNLNDVWVATPPNSLNT